MGGWPFTPAWLRYKPSKNRWFPRQISIYHQELRNHAWNYLPTSQILHSICGRHPLPSYRNLIRSNKKLSLIKFQGYRFPKYCFSTGHFQLKQKLHPLFSAFNTSYSEQKFLSTPSDFPNFSKISLEKKKLSGLPRCKKLWSFSLVFLDTDWTVSSTKSFSTFISNRPSSSCPQFTANTNKSR